MPKFLDTKGRTKIAIAICGRCSRKFPYDELVDDPNFPGLRVCPEDRDNLDPWRLPARETEDITLEYPRPDSPISDFGHTALFGQGALNPDVAGAPLLAEPVTSLGPARPWQPNTWYNKGETITPQNVDDKDVNLPQPWLVCMVSGLSGSVPPEFPTKTGVLFQEPR